MIEFAVAIGLLVGLVSTRKLWNQWLKLQAESTSIWVKDSEVELQDKIAEVRKLQDEAITRNGKWLSLKDLDR
jgi:hypothetical protein